MRLSTRSTYSMRALVELALMGGRAPMSAARIAKRQHLSIAYLEQLLHRLKQQRLVRSVRGPKGGYLLAKAPQQITMADVVRVLDGIAGPEPGRRPNGARQAAGNGHGRRTARGHETGDGQRHAQRIAQAVWRCVHERLTESLGTVTLQDLCDEARALDGEPLDHRYVFHI